MVAFMQNSKRSSTPAKSSNGWNAILTSRPRECSLNDKLTETWRDIFWPNAEQKVKITGQCKGEQVERNRVHTLSLAELQE